MTDEPKWGVQHFKPGDRVRCVETYGPDWYQVGEEFVVFLEGRSRRVKPNHSGIAARWELVDPTPRGEWFAVDFADTSKDLPAWLREDGVRLTTNATKADESPELGYPAAEVALGRLHLCVAAYRPAPPAPTAAKL